MSLLEIIWFWIDILVIYFKKKAMEKVEQIIEFSSELEKIQQFCDFIEDAHSITTMKKI